MKASEVMPGGKARRKQILGEIIIRDPNARRNEEGKLIFFQPKPGTHEINDKGAVLLHPNTELSPF